MHLRDAGEYERHRFGRLTLDNIEPLRQLSILERCRHLGVPPYRLPGLILEVGRQYRDKVRSIDFNEGIPELLAELRSLGRKSYILSSNEEGNIRAFLEHRSAQTWVEDIHCSSRIFGKARLLRALMKRYGLSAEQLVYVGDEERDVNACREAGVRVIAVRWGFDSETRLRLAGPDALVERPEEIAEYVRRGHP